GSSAIPSATWTRRSATSGASCSSDICWPSAAPRPTSCASATRSSRRAVRAWPTSPYAPARSRQPPEPDEGTTDVVDVVLVGEVGKSISTVTATSSPLIEMTAAVGGGAGGVFGVVAFVFGAVPDFDVDGPVAAVAPDFWTDWRNGSLLSKCANSVSWPGSGCTC